MRGFPGPIRRLLRGQPLCGACPPPPPFPVSHSVEESLMSRPSLSSLAALASCRRSCRSSSSTTPPRCRPSRSGLTRRAGRCRRRHRPRHLFANGSATAGRVDRRFSAAPLPEQRRRRLRHAPPTSTWRTSTPRCHRRTDNDGDMDLSMPPAAAAAAPAAQQRPRRVHGHDRHQRPGPRAEVFCVRRRDVDNDGDADRGQ